ncbi:hypothetical protein V502_03725 [Pseudogymnoascus sp. VKM F-4520 (FW-2644)]|nr:hypothetical protein V502_03725 [Pseudogymnoascus sp. VKM F-4520 (FW-2644)]
MDGSDGTNLTEEICTDQYHHFIPRFILRKFAQPCLKTIMVWNWFTGNISSHDIKDSFGMFNLYNTDNKSKNTNDNNVEKLFASLECAMGAIVKKIEDVLAPPSKGGLMSLRSVPLLQSEISTVYKFISLSGFRNGPVGLHDNHEPLPSYNRKETHQEWVAKLKFLLEESHDELLAMDELLQPHTIRPIISRYRQIGEMKLHFWTAPKGEEFLLNNLFVGLEGSQVGARNSVSSNMRLPAHVYIPVSPEILIVLCAESLCQHSLLKNAQHEVTTPFNRPAKGKVGKTEGRRRFQPMVYNWKTSYPITPLSVNDFRTVNGHILGASSLLVYRSRFAVDHAVNNILPFSDTHAIWSKEDRKHTPNETQGAREEEGEREELQLSVWLLICELSAMISENTDGKPKEEFISEIEILGKVACFAFSRADEPFCNGIFCKPGMYFMGDKKDVA